MFLFKGRQSVGVVVTRESLALSISEIRSGKWWSFLNPGYQFLGIFHSRRSALAFVRLVLPFSHLSFSLKGRWRPLFILYHLVSCSPSRRCCWVYNSFKIFISLLWTLLGSIPLVESHTHKSFWGKPFTTLSFWWEKTLLSFLKFSLIVWENLWSTQSFPAGLLSDPVVPQYSSEAPSLTFPRS